jgi:hypothetical protein
MLACFEHLRFKFVIVFELFIQIIARTDAVHDFCDTLSETLACLPGNHITIGFCFKRNFRNRIWAHHHSTFSSSFNWGAAVSTRNHVYLIPFVILVSLILFQYSFFYPLIFDKKVFFNSNQFL